MQKIYIAKPGAQKEGPYTIEQINRYLATNKISETDFWAWYEGLPSWMPLYSVLGGAARAGDTALPEDEPPQFFRKAESDPIARQVKQVKAVPNNSKPETARAIASPAKPEQTISKVETARVTESGPETKGGAARAPYTALPEDEPPQFFRKVESDPIARQVKQVKAVPNNPKPETAPAIAAPTKPEQTISKVETARVAKAGPEAKMEGQVFPLTAEAETVAQRAAKPGAERTESLTTPATQPEQAVQPKAPSFPTSSTSAGKPFTALEQIFVFTTAEGPTAFKSEITAAMLREATGEKVEHINGKVPVDVMGVASAGVLEAIRAGTIPNSVWRALFKIKASVAQQMQDGAYHLCVRTFPLESKDLVALFLLYNKQKL